VLRNTLHHGTQRLQPLSFLVYLSLPQKIVIEGKKYSWYVCHMAKIPHSSSAYHPVATPASRVIALPLANTRTDHSSRYKRRVDRLLNVRTAVNFARRSRFTSSVTAVMYVPGRANRVQVNLPASATARLLNLFIHSSQENAGPRISKRSPRNPLRPRHSEFGTRF
jgi:hypothetical protein